MGSNPPNEPALDDNPHLVFISDASAEAERLALALRARGYGVVDVPLSLLVGRVSLQRPAIILLDADAEGAPAALTALADMQQPTPVVLLQSPGKAHDSWTGTSPSALFERPIPVRHLMETVTSLIGAPEGTVPAHSMPPSMRSPVLLTGAYSTPLRPPKKPSEPAPSAPPTPPELELKQPGDPKGQVPHAALSHEIAELLREAERRVGTTTTEAASQREGPSVEESVAAELPPDVLAALDEPLDIEGTENGPDSGGPSSRRDRDTGSTTGPGTHEADDDRSGPVDPGERPGTSTIGPDAVGTAVTEDGGTAAFTRNPTTAIESHPPQAPGTSGGSDPGPDLQARQRAPTPRPPRGGATAAGQSEPPTPKPRVQTEPPRTQLQPDLFGDAPSSARHYQTSVDHRTASTAEPKPASEHPPPSNPTSFTKTAPPSRPHTEPPPASAPDDLAIPRALGEADSIRAVSRAVRSRFTGGLAFEIDEGIRRIVFRDGDFVTAASGVHGESLVAFLVDRGDLPPEAAREAHKLATSGRHAGAALIAQGFLAQDQLWVVLRGHAEWVVGQVLQMGRGTARAEDELPGRLQDEPAVFGGATGAEVLVELVRRVVSPEDAVERLGGWFARVRPTTQSHLLAECALPSHETEIIQGITESLLHELVDRTADPSFASALYALNELGVVSVTGAQAEERKSAADAAIRARDTLDDEAIREKITARKALVDHGDYFAVLGVRRSATGYEIRRAYTALRREFEPSRILTPGTADLRDDVSEIVDVLEEAYDILRDQVRRERYCRAIEATP